MKTESQCATVYFYSLAPSNQPSKNKSTPAIPLIFQAPMRSSKAFPPALWTFNSFSNDLLAAWPPNDHASSHVLPLWGSVLLITTVPLMGLPFPHSRSMLPRQNCQLLKNLNGNSSEEHANIVSPTNACKDWITSSKLSQILVLLANLLCDPDRDKHFPGGSLWRPVPKLCSRDQTLQL